MTSPETPPDETPIIRASDTLRGERNAMWFTMALLMLAIVGLLWAVLR